MQYGDFLLMGWDRTENLLGKKVDFLDYFDWLRQDNFARLEDELSGRLGFKNFPKLQDKHLLESIFIVTENDFRKKEKDRNFYACHALCLLKVMRTVFTAELYEVLRKYAEHTHTAFIVEDYREIFRKLLLDAEDLCSLYSQNFTSGSEFSSFIRGRFIHVASIYQVLRQGLYGSASLHAFADQEPSAAIGVIRQLVELRIRRAFGCLGFTDTAGNNVFPLDMSTIFEVLKTHEKDITFQISLDSIIKIYNWSNDYIHTGRGYYNWVPYYLEIILRPLMFGLEEACDMKSGISTSQTVIDAVQSELIANRNVNCNPAKFVLITCDPECMLQ